MDIRELRTFIAVAKTGNITRAAEELHISQPALSRQIIKLENELGCKLLERGSHGISLTNAGHLLLNRARELSDLLDKTETELKTPDVASGEVSIACNETSATLAIARIAKRLSRTHPGIRFKFRSEKLGRCDGASIARHRRLRHRGGPRPHGRLPRTQATGYQSMGRSRTSGRRPCLHTARPLAHIACRTHLEPQPPTLARGAGVFRRRRSVSGRRSGASATTTATYTPPSPDRGSARALTCRHRRTQEGGRRVSARLVFSPS